VDFKAIFKKIIRIPPVHGMTIGLIINVLAVPIPAVAMDLLEVLAKGNKPIVLILMGIYLNFVFNKSQLWAAGKVLLIRYACGLSAVALLYFGLPASTLQSIMIVCVILPVGLTILPFSDELNYDTKVAGLLANLSLLISFGLIWALVLGLNLV
jgi:malate permease and related proteins